MLALKMNREKKDKKRKKKDGVKPVKKKFKGTGLRIVDEDEPFGFNRNKNNEESSDDQEAEELPQIAAVVDERPHEVQMLEEFQKGKWKQIGITKEDGDSPSGTRHDSDDDGSPSSQTRQRHDSDNDLSPPRSRRRHDSDDQSPPRSRKRHDSGDQSPPRAKKRNDSDTDLSPPRLKGRSDSNDRSHPRSKKRKDSDTDLSPPRSRRRSDSNDRSPPRSKRRHNRDDISPHRRPVHKSQGSRRSIANPEVIEAASSNTLPGTTLEGKKAGLVRAKDLQSEMVDFTRKENEMFANLDDDVSGRVAKTKLRDRKTGRERDLVAELAKKEEDEKIAAEKKKQYDKWGRGLKQVEAQSMRVNEALHEISKPLARYANDEDLDEFLKGQDRDGDPMLKFLSSKKGNSSSDKPKYNGPPPAPNRFGLLPAYRWDGVDRSNGYEKEWFSRINAKKARQEEAYKWSVEDL